MNPIHGFLDSVLLRLRNAFIVANKCDYVSVAMPSKKKKSYSLVLISSIIVSCGKKTDYDVSDLMLSLFQEYN